MKAEIRNMSVKELIKEWITTKEFKKKLEDNLYDIKNWETFRKMDKK